MTSRGNSQRPGRPPARTVEGRENQLIAAAYDLAEKQIANGSATAQVITHFLKLGTAREKLEQERLKQENQLTAARIDNLSSQANTEKLYNDALNAMRSYSGLGVSDEPQD
jgi:sensor histidine kinase YesM